MEPISLRTERLLLRPLTPADIPAVHAACQDPEIPRYTPVPSPYTHEDARVYIEETCPRYWREDTAYTFGVFTRDDNRLTGVMCLVRLQLEAPERQAEIGYWTAREARGHGYTVEAAREAARWAFEDLGVERLEWVAQAGNEPSRQVALRLGFRMEGLVRALIVHGGVRHDAWRAALLPGDLGLPSKTPYVPYAG
ncbi:GNAT family N-acetyltransferase [Streptomyces sp. NPDC052396]|uniref:GNAT family N-acetyltransferase n=1 Tax=Streptomyces sp. NPDC052396 TaxID=3365689 RepID=UPI0037D1A72D